MNRSGSSGGSRAAIADGLITLAEGTDTRDSSRISTAWCRIYAIHESDKNSQLDVPSATYLFKVNIKPP
ncbi:MULTISPECIES: amidase family protein [Oceanobacillus]|uniref:amidase family protein n=1 Tax=Oceanobacillus TaxID=182709 RepID=UPI0012EC776D|nr:MULTISPECIES: amidase family protein [Oceanobacillus]